MILMFMTRDGDQPIETIGAAEACPRVGEHIVVGGQRREVLDVVWQFEDQTTTTATNVTTATVTILVSDGLAGG